MKRVAVLIRGCLLGVLVWGVVPSSFPALGVMEDTIDVSPDGTVYAERFGGLLADTVLVPQGTVTDTFHVRNSSDVTGYVRVVVTDVEATDVVFVESSSVRLSSDDQGWDGVALGDAQPCAQVANDLVLRPGETQALTAALALDDADGTELQNESLSFSFHLMMSDEPIPDSESCLTSVPNSPPPHGGPGAGAPPQLGGTGLALPLAAVVVAVGLGTVGAVMASRRRKRRD